MKFFASLQPEIQATIIQTFGTCITAFASVVVIAITYGITKQLKFFEVFLSKKTAAYENFIKCVISDSHTKMEDFENMSNATAVALLYCNTKSINTLKDFHNIVVKLERIRMERKDGDLPRAKELLDEYLKGKSVLMDSFREDIDNCRKFRFK